MNIYLAARYSRRLELCGYRQQLRELGHAVDAVWLNGEHQIANDGTPIGESGEALVEQSEVNRCPVSFPHPQHDYCDGKPAALRSGERLSQDDNSDRAAALRQKFAQDDFRDVMACDLLIAFTEQPRTDKGRGGRHVELGLALGMGKKVWVVGHRENIFCWLEHITFFETWKQCFAALAAEGTELPPNDAYAMSKD